MDANLVAGVRFEDTDVTASSVVQAPETMVWESDNDWSVLLKNGAPEVYAQDHSYSVALPNIDFDIAVTEDVKVRLSYSETIGRAGYDQLSPDVSIDNAYSLEASGGNPQLDPMRSSNIDLSVEYYFADDSFVSAGFFIKDVSDFIGTVSEERSHYGLTDPREGARNAAAIARIQNEGGNVNSEQDLHDAMLRNEGLDPADPSTSIFSSSADDLAVFDTLLPGNDKSTTIDGIELAYTQWFGTSGFGLQANYTMVNADVEYDNTVIEGEQFVMPGLSDSMNIVGFYDANGIQARIAYNWRDEYLSDRNAGGGNPAYTEAFSQIDLSFSYDLNDNVTFTAEGINVTGEDSRVHGRSERQIYSLEDLGARYQVGVRYSF
jgi:Outer membrane receptor proteins, mostly Fe transport